MLPWLNNDRTIRIAVIGDIILDEYLEGSVTRISPEAPVPVHLVKKSHWTAGGAANTARNIQLAGGQASLFGVWGQDEAARILKGLLEKDGIDTEAVQALADRPTIKKTRITSGHQQMLRVDWEKAQAIEDQEQAALLSALGGNDFDGILISDYGKGGLPEALFAKIFAYAADKAIPCVVDPKGKNFYKYRGSTLLTPNRKEACEALGLDPEEQQSGEELGRRLQDTFGLDDVLVTMGAFGMVYVPAGSVRPAIHKSPQAREVFDVSGAGDTVAAMMTLVMAAGEDTEVAMEYANLAAGLVVEKWGTQPIQRQELEELLKKEQAKKDHSEHAPACLSSEKIIKEDALAAMMQDLREDKKSFVFTNGCFDLLHAGHLTYLEKAKTLGDFLIVGINSDESISRLKGKGRPLVPLEQRMKLLSGLSCIDFVIAFGEDTPKRLIELLRPQVLVKGADYCEDEIVGADVVKAQGGQVKTLPLLAGISTSEIVNRIKASCKDY